MKSKIEVAVLDFDGTLVTEDILDKLCSLVGKEKESLELNNSFRNGNLPGISALVARINLLSGLTVKQIQRELSKNLFLMPGANELLSYFKSKNILTILASGNILSVLEYYQNKLEIDFVVGSEPFISDGKITGIAESSYSSADFKTDGVKKILSQFDFKKESIVAIGDSPGDKGIFEMSGTSIAINPKGNIAEFADFTIYDNLKEVIKIL